MPKETHALLVTDVVDSTKLTEELGDAHVAEVWTAHDRLARDLLAAHKGREIDKTDGFLLLFQEASQAIAYALDYHRALKDLDLEARAGLHVGDVVLRENTSSDIARGAKPLEVEGLAKPITARVMSVAQGGQTLLTRAARDAVEGIPLRLESHGHWRMKGVLQPIELFEAGDAGAPFTPPPDAPKAWRVQRQDGAWVPVRDVPHSLPRERDAFVGRERDLQALAERLDTRAALVTVLGIGGTGKTRLVTHFGWTWLGDWPGGVWFCDLSEARSADGIAYAVGRSLEVALGPEAITQLGHAIAGRGRALIVLDNFEQVARHAKETLGHWLDRAPDAQFVVTTREVLGLRGETTLALAPLDDTDGVDLFVARARQAARDFTLDAEDKASVHELVLLLDGLPLAIELAAARVRLMAPRTLLARMSQRFRLLTSTGGRRDRQATLRGALDWSWDLLSDDEQAALAQVSVFEGGFSLEAAAAVLDLAELWPEDAVSALLDKSLVRRVSDDRYDLLMSVQEYAAERLDTAGGRVAAETLHGAHFARFGRDEALEALDVHGGVERRWALSVELDNLVAAARRAVARGAGDVAAASLAAAWSGLQLRGPFAVAADLAQAALGIESLAPQVRGSVDLVLGKALRALGRGAQARPPLEEASTLACEVDDRRLEAGALCELGNLDSDQGLMDAAQVHYDRALAVTRELGYRPLESVVLSNLGNLHSERGLKDAARADYDRALAVAREVGNRRFEGIVHINLGGLHHEQGQIDEAWEHANHALAVAREIGDRAFEGQVLGNLGILELMQGRLDEAHTHYEQALALHREVGDRVFEGRVLGNLGGMHWNQERPDEALAYFDRALVVHREVGNRRSEAIVLRSVGHLHGSQGRFDEARASFDAGEVLARAVGDPTLLGELLCGRVRLEHPDGSLDVARAALEEAEALAQQVGAGPGSRLVRELAEARAALEASADPEP